MKEGFGEQFGACKNEEFAVIQSKKGSGVECKDGFLFG